MKFIEVISLSTFISLQRKTIKSIGNYWHLKKIELAFAFCPLKCLNKFWTLRKRKLFKFGLFDDQFENTTAGILLEFVQMYYVSLKFHFH